jgi:hypothetical protein
MVMGLISEGSSGPSPPGGGGGISSTSDKVEPVPVSGKFHVSRTHKRPAKKPFFDEANETLFNCVSL